MLTILWWLLTGFLLLPNGPQTVSGTLKTGIVTVGGDCAHRWWLQPDASGKQNRPLVALEPEDKVPPELNNRHVQVEGNSKICYGVEGGKYTVLVIERLKPTEK